MDFYKEGKHYFWNTAKNTFYEKNIYDCVIRIEICLENIVEFQFLTKGTEILFAEFKKIKATDEFVKTCLKHKSRRSKKPVVFLTTHNFEKETLINFLLSAKGGDTPVNDAFDKFVCLWL